MERDVDELRKELLEQYQAAHESIVWHDRSSTGKIIVRGEDRFTWLQGMISNDTKKLAKDSHSSPIQACLLDATGHIISELTLSSWKLADVDPKILAQLNRLDDFIMIDLPAETLKNTLRLLDRYLITEDVELIDATERLGCIALLGDRLSVLERLTGIAIQIETKVGEISGANVYFVEADREAVMQIIREHNILELDPEAVEILRVEAGVPKYGAELDESVIALEAGLGPTHISFTKGCYVGQEIIARIDSRGHTNRALTGFLIQSGTLPAVGSKLYAATEEGWKETGRLTSVISESPSMGFKPIALGYSRHEHRTPGTTLSAGDVTMEVRAEVVEIPFRADSVTMY